MAPEDEIDADEIPEELEDQYDPDEVFKIDASPEELADALFKESE